MKWTDKAPTEFYGRFKAELSQLQDHYLLQAINAAYLQNDQEEIPYQLEMYITRNARISIALDLLYETDHCDEGTNEYWIDKEGKYKVILR